MPARPLKIGLISANWGVKCHLPAWRAVDGCEVVAICTSREETATRAATANGIPRAYADYRKMAADPDIDVIDVGTRPALRYHMVKAALEAGKHVYAGVPFAANVAQARELVRLADTKDLKGASDAYFQYIPAHQELKKRIDAGEIGEILSVSLDLQINLFNPPQPNHSYYWFADRSNGASVLRNLGTHTFTLLSALFGNVEEAIGRQFLNIPEWISPELGRIKPQVPDTAVALLQFRRGMIATINLSWVDAGPVGWRLDVHGAKGRFTVTHPLYFPNSGDFNGGEVRLYTSSPAAVEEKQVEISREFTHAPQSGIDHEFKPRPCYPMALSFHRLKAAIDGIGAASPSFDQALHAEEVIDAIIRSEQSRAWERVRIADTRISSN